MHIIQAPLLSFNDFFKLDFSDRLLLVLETINAKKLLRAVEADSPAGPKGYPARVLWSALIAGVVYRLPTIAELIRHLNTNPWYRAPSRAEAEARLGLWEASVKEQGPAAFRALLPMLRNWRQEIPNYFDYRYTNGFVEGKNNRIKVIKRIAYGYRNSHNFRQRVLLTNIKEHHSKAA